MWEFKNLSGDIDLRTAPETSAPTQGTAPGVAADGWYRTVNAGFVWDELVLLIDTDATDLDLVPWFHVPDFNISAGVGRHVPGRLEEDITATATAAKGRVFRLVGPPMASYVRLQQISVTGETYAVGAIYGTQPRR